MIGLQRVWQYYYDLALLKKKVKSEAEKKLKWNEELALLIRFCPRLALAVYAQ